VAYRPSSAGFELNAGSALAGVFPASFQAAAVGSTLTLVWLLLAGLIDEGLSFAALSFWAIPGLLFMMLVTTIIGTAFCAFYIAIVGVPVAWLLGRRLAAPLGLGVAVCLAVLAGAVLGSTFWAAPVFGDDGWLFALIVMAYALPAGLFYRQAVLTARSLNPYAEADVSA
jgi:hypothetical protein